MKRFHALMLAAVMMMPFALQAEPKGERGEGRPKVNLTEDQQAKIKALREEQKKAIEPLFAKNKELMDTLRKQVEKKAGDAEIKKTMDALKANRDALRQQHEAFAEKRDAILTPSQRAEMMLRRPRMGGGSGEWRGHKGKGRDHDGDDEELNEHEKPSMKPVEMKK